MSWAKVRSVFEVFFVLFRQLGVLFLCGLSLQYAVDSGYFNTTSMVFIGLGLSVLMVNTVLQTYNYLVGEDEEDD